MFAGLVTYLVLADEPRHAPRQEEAQRQSKVLPELDPGKVTAVTLRGARDTVRVELGEEVLEEHFPWQPGDINELPDQIIEE